MHSTKINPFVCTDYSSLDMKWELLVFSVLVLFVQPFLNSQQVLHMTCVMHRILADLLKYSLFIGNIF